MRIPQRRLELKELDDAYGDYYVTIPRSLPEGTLNFIQARNLEAQRISQRQDAAESPEEKVEIGKQLQDFQRESSAMVLDLITDWNIDDDNGGILQMPREIPDSSGKIAVVAKLPIEVITYVAQEIWNPPSRKAAVSEETRDFSNGSSEAS